MHGTSTDGKNKFKGVRRRKWGKWVSEIRVPGTQERLWLGTYATPEAAAVAHDVAVYCLRRPSTLDKLNFPDTLSSYRIQQKDMVMSPRSVQKVASDVAMDVDARNIAAKTTSLPETETHVTVINDEHVHNVGPADDIDDNNNSAGVFCWEGFGDEDLNCEGTNLQATEALSISIEDYL